MSWLAGANARAFGMWRKLAQALSRRSRKPTPLCASGHFFFQAEDGIRDHCVTGVQTCALPIFYNAARMKDAGMNFVKEAAMTKLFASQVAERVASLAIEIYGGYGFTKDHPVEKYYRSEERRVGKEGKF